MFFGTITHMFNYPRALLNKCGRANICRSLLSSALYIDSPSIGDHTGAGTHIILRALGNGKVVVGKIAVLEPLSGVGQGGLEPPTFAV